MLATGPSSSSEIASAVVSPHISSSDRQWSSSSASSRVERLRLQEAHGGLQETSSGSSRKETPLTSSDPLASE
eukprot:6956376-Heterocapsa_arctica.AAC.1